MKSCKRLNPLIFTHQETSDDEGLETLCSQDIGSQLKLKGICEHEYEEILFIADYSSCQESICIRAAELIDKDRLCTEQSILRTICEEKICP